MNEKWVFNYSNKVDITINTFEVGIYLFNRFWKMCLFSPRLQLFIQNTVKKNNSLIIYLQLTILYYFNLKYIFFISI